MCTVNQMKDLVNFTELFVAFRNAYFAQCNSPSHHYDHRKATQDLERAGDNAWAMICVCVLADMDCNIVCPEAVRFVKDYKIQTSSNILKEAVA